MGETKKAYISLRSAPRIKILQPLGDDGSFVYTGSGQGRSRYAALEGMGYKTQQWDVAIRYRALSLPPRVVEEVFQSAIEQDGHHCLPADKMGKGTSGGENGCRIRHVVRR